MTWLTVYRRLQVFNCFRIILVVGRLSVGFFPGKKFSRLCREKFFRFTVEFWRFVFTFFRNSVKSFKDRAFAGPGKIPQIPQLIERGKARTEVFFDFLNKVLKNTKYVAGNKFSIADIDAYVTLSFAKWIKVDGTEKRKNIKNWSLNLEKRKSFIKYNNLFRK